MITRTEPRACPRCAHPLDAYSDALGGGAKPSPGDLSVCSYCAAPLRLGAALEPLLLSKAEFIQLPIEAQNDLAAALRAVLLGMERRGYGYCRAKLVAAAGEFVSKHGAGRLLFTLPPEGMAVLGPLSGRALDALGANELSREFLRYLDEATDHEATIIMAIEMIEAIGLLTTEPPEVSPWAFLLQQGGDPS